MSILQEFENIKYRCVLDLMKNTEHYDKKKAVITGEDAFKIVYKRYLLMQEIFLPLKEKLGERVDLTDITFINNMQDDTNIVIKYTKDGKNYVLTLSNLDYEDINIVSTDVVAQQEDFVDANKRIIINTFRDISNNSLDDEISIKSTSGKFIIEDNCDRFKISDIGEKIFSLETKYSTYEKNNGLFGISKLTCNFPRLKELLSDNFESYAVYKNLRVYEEDIPKKLIKKIN